ncbi:MAG TPA: YigZ family protein [Candidatus Angelobacter sp.]|nr:YigZ family protein [Candidatus Angelobacter sp.]
MTNFYYTVKKAIENEIVIQKSKFISHVHHVSNEDEAQRLIQAKLKAHYKSNHNCYAYVLGDNNQVQKASDDGEPSGTAGVPILEVLKKQDLKDTLVVVTRYFGGIKLGAGGLIRAYSTATSEGIKAAGIIERLPIRVYGVIIDYTLWGTLENALRQSPYLLINTAYTDRVTLEIGVTLPEDLQFEKWLTELCNGKVQVELLREEFIEQDKY